MCFQCYFLFYLVYFLSFLIDLVNNYIVYIHPKVLNFLMAFRLLLPERLSEVVGCMTVQKSQWFYLANLLVYQIINLIMLILDC